MEAVGESVIALKKEMEASNKRVLEALEELKSSPRSNVETDVREDLRALIAEAFPSQKVEIDKRSDRTREETRAWSTVAKSKKTKLPKAMATSTEIPPQAISVPITRPPKYKNPALMIDVQKDDFPARLVG